ncbi:uncharacterized protein IUM83_13593 [Phytophthora cinnamomi]|uniref:uncharacterized protein n=1 Tax=Phytophthora cinnamomi TaxID=4785 RepID=UPI00355A65FC|nr:hypothetical protein IUM83_13593 [Phytophthora cinnamomi]
MLTSLFDLSRMIKEIRETTNKEIDQAIASALLIAHKYPELQEEPMLPTRPFPSRSDIFKVQKIKATTDYIASEFMKALMPAAHSCYLVLLFHLPNRRFYSQFEGLDEAGLWKVVAHIQIYGLLEAILLVLLLRTLQKMAYNFPVQHLAFAIDSSWGKIQCKLVAVTVLLLQSTIPQLGTDYTFKFEWTHKQ